MASSSPNNLLCVRPLALGALCTMTALAIHAGADEPASLLVRLDKETQALYRDVQDGVARVQLPTPRWIKNEVAVEDPVRAWPGLNDATRNALEVQRRRVAAGIYRPVIPNVIPATQPKGPHSYDPTWPSVPTTDGGIIFTAPQSNETALHILTGGAINADGDIEPTGAAVMRVQPVAGFSPNNVGLVVDNAAHLLVPLYVEKEDVPDGIKVSVGQKPVVNAVFVGSDRPSMLSVFRLPDASARPVKVGARRPAEGSLVLLLAPNAAGSRLILWAGDKADVSGVVVSVDGGVNGLARGGGQFLSVAAYKPVVDELVHYGHVRRATLGVRVLQIPPGDAARPATTSLGNRPALRVLEVTADSVAAKAGVKQGDFLVSFAGEDVGDPNDLASLLAGRSGPATLKLFRDVQPLDVTVDLKPGE